MRSDLRRDTAAVLAALAIDPARRELYVEGPHDRQVLLWLAHDKTRGEVVVQDINAVHVPGVVGGNRGRLVAFARAMVGEARVRFFADADYDRLLGIPLPANAWFTDYHDMEAYAIWTDCGHKAMRLAAGRSKSEARSAVEQSLAAARKTGYVRIADVINRWQLPFQRFPPARQARVRGNTLEFNWQRWITSLVSASSTGAASIGDVTRRVAEIASNFSGTTDHEIVHGKDFVGFLGEFLIDHGISRSDAAAVVWAGLERRALLRFANLRAAIDFLVA